MDARIYVQNSFQDRPFARQNAVVSTVQHSVVIFNGRPVPIRVAFQHEAFVSQELSTMAAAVRSTDHWRAFLVPACRPVDLAKKGRQKRLVSQSQQHPTRAVRGSEDDPRLIPPHHSFD
jgi:hypothetical protein